MNDLNAQQIVLLCLLVSFVSSVATGITTVSLLGQSPQPVSQTINRVVERTIEKVVDPVVDTVRNETRPVERIVETVVVNQEDLTVEAVSKNEKSLVRVFGHDRFGKRFFAGIGVVFASDGKIVTSASVADLSNSFEADYVEGNFDLNIVGAPSQGVAILSPMNVEEGKTFSSAVFSNSQNLKLGQSVIALTGQSANTVSTGIITGLDTADGALTQEQVQSGAQPTQTISQINTSIVPESIIRGSMLLNLKGEIIGLRVAGVTAGSFVPANVVKSIIGN
jgi:serine protease Do